ncbi:para-aminobenzoate synthetase component 2 [Micrococcus cohnii]|uniref:Para-aminobenzoate synthetase component 2 n=1 Tax=Micrococcus cohnii TaxID=993416 RepID=A0A7W7GQB3_9MICC|nr:aminodeoxychorismate/anthranilate synthase component II [Micrococcus cohnii]MBB4736285.1 para-aminobenzoate synthetase component 2 [Micrococcus cohnii]
MPDRATAESRGPSVLVIDNQDSFVHTIADYLQQLGARTRVVRNNQIAPQAACELADRHDGILISPGPGAPADAGVSPALIRHAADVRRPLLGVCLGHQGIAEAYGARVGHARELMHGKTSRVRHNGHPLFAGLPDPFTATRYHSLAVERATVDEQALDITAETDDGVVMGLAHRDLPLWGVQFHPESILTEGGHRLFRNWLDTLG